MSKILQWNHTLQRYGPLCGSSEGQDAAALNALPSAPVSILDACKLWRDLLSTWPAKLILQGAGYAWQCV